MLKKAFSTVACMDAGYADIISICLKHAINGVEIRLGDDGSICGLTSADEIGNMRREFDKNGILITDLGSSACFTAYSDEVLKKAKQAADTAKAVGSKAIRVFLGYFNAVINPDKPEPDYDGIVKALRELCEYGRDIGVEIWIETHNEFATGAVLKKLLADVNSDNAKIIWDVIHPIEDGEDIEETWAAIGKSIAHVHIKDGFDRLDPKYHDYKYTPLGKGAMPLCALLNLLDKVGYDGYISLEWESAWREELKALPQDMDYILGGFNGFLDAYSRNKAEDFTREWSCFDALKQVSEREFDANGSTDFSANGVIARLEVSEDVPALKKYMHTAWIDKNTAYTISVVYAAEGTQGHLAAYGIITLWNESGEMTRRLYLDRPVHNRMELTFESREETSVTIELGLKRAGRAKFYQPMLVPCAPRTERKVKIASCHLHIVPGIEYEDNLKRIGELIDKAVEAGADIASFAETMGDRGVALAEHERFEPLDGRFCSFMRKKAAEGKCYITFTFHEVDEKGLRYNTAVLVDRNGEIVGTYRKSHITISEYERGMVPGNSYPVFNTEFGKVAMLTCWDVYFPETVRAMALRGAEILFVSTAGNPTYRHIARAKENGIFVVVSCAHNEAENGIKPTKIISPCGEILAHTNDDMSFAFAEVDCNKDETISWLSVGAAGAEPKQVYLNEYRDDMLCMIDPGIL